jgi:hypothetical protein
VPKKIRNLRVEGSRWIARLLKVGFLMAAGTVAPELWKSRINIHRMPSPLFTDRRKMNLRAAIYCSMAIHAARTHRNTEKVLESGNSIHKPLLRLEWSIQEKSSQEKEKHHHGGCDTFGSQWR